MQALDGLNGLMVKQQKEWGEILTGFEQKNKYAVSDTSGNTLFAAVEEGGNMFLRLFLKAARPFEVGVYSLDQQPLIRVVRPFRFFFHEATVVDGQGNALGTLRRRFSLLRRIYSVYDPSGQERFELFGPILHPWTFEIRDQGREVGKITKKWSGLMKEGFTDADNFGVTFPADWDVNLKALFLGAVFLIDFVHFENKGDN